ncbi:MAG: diguanylate cyclase [Sulfurimonas sp.]|jgi:diguanylate cyclase|nr:diguanylate cyclase [Sulfurimonas sp.]MBU1217775.1 diguanylate cyclase [bacterium]MBU1434197.1 diguanylate cyclase [bacterium]MBU1504292.1 diguanylate cyclase [bacterium]MBU3939405.1 diguanylate cyclase [bacterium]
MSGTLRGRNRRDISEVSNTSSSPIKGLDMDEASSDIEIYAKEVLSALIAGNLPPTPNNFSLYFDRLLEDKSENLRKQIVSMLELEDTNNDENSIALEQSLKQGFSSVKSILSVTANLYKNMALMSKILEKRRKELQDHPEIQEAMGVVSSLEGDVSKLSDILKKQSSQMKIMYDETASIVKNVENETVFDNQFGVYNKRYLMGKIEQETGLMKEFKHKSSLIFIELSRELSSTVNNEKAILLMTRTIARLLLKTSRRSDIVAHYGGGKFAMLLKHTDLDNAKRTSERLCDLVSNSNFFLSDREIQLRISIGITNIDALHSVEEIVVSALEGIEKAYTKQNVDYAVVLRTNNDNII